jgi:hypothetical protein
LATKRLRRFIVRLAILTALPPDEARSSDCPRSKFGAKFTNGRALLNIGKVFQAQVKIAEPGGILDNDGSDTI